mmetsp:Transcript_37124/g.89545  ORF Transcript_37124/g.89545 Transcript_37124/m.89545 type:complete len:208 (-) Transcript_37124:901-1524(-)
MVAAQRSRHHHALLVNFFVLTLHVVGHDPIFDNAQRQGARLRLANDGCAALDAKRAEVDHREGSHVAKAGHGRGIVAALDHRRGQGDVVGYGFQSPASHVPDYGGVEPRPVPDHDVDVHRVVRADEAAVHPRCVGGGHGLHRSGCRLHQKIVDGDSVVILVQLHGRVQIRAQVQEGIQRQVDAEVVMRNVLLRGGESGRQFECRGGE